jgi:hypothetical protein
MTHTSKLTQANGNLDTSGILANACPVQNMDQSVSAPTCQAPLHLCSLESSKCYLVTVGRLPGIFDSQ